MGSWLGVFFLGPHQTAQLGPVQEKARPADLLAVTGQAAGSEQAVKRRAADTELCNCILKTHQLRQYGPKCNTISDLTAIGTVWYFRPCALSPDTLGRSTPHPSYFGIGL